MKTIATPHATKKGRNPQTPAEWREAVDAAYVMLTIHSAVCFGLITTDLQIDVARCEEILTRGRELGITPDPDAIRKSFASERGAR